MNPIQITETLRESMIRYLLTTFNVNRDGQEPELRAALRDSFYTNGALFNGPYLELTLPYITGATLEGLVAQDILSPSLLKLDCFGHGKPIWPDTPLYKHQEIAIRQLSAEKHNIIVSSGTGSGKTECFLIPILNDLLLDPSPGVRAVIIYPLNALVNDQLDRLRSLLAGTEITFGRYTGELPQKLDQALKEFEQDPLPNEVICRDQIQKEGKIPQILITNYAMLEYLLLRPADAPLFQGGAWRFIVLDEAHTHAGAQGIEIGLLMRRLRHRMDLAPEDTRCIATSATLTDDDAEEAAKFGEALFGVPFESDDVIFGQVSKGDYAAESKKHIDPGIYLHKKFPTLIESVRKQDRSTDELALHMKEIGLVTSEEIEDVNVADKTPQQFLWHVLKSNADLYLLRDLLAQKGDPIAVQMAAKDVFGDRLQAEDREQALFHLIELGAIARENKDAPTLLPARYHLFARPPQGIWVCLNPKCPGREHAGKTGWSRIFAMRRERCDACGAALYPLYVCRTCGQPYIRGEQSGSRLLAEANPILDTHPVYFAWRDLIENQALADLDEEDLELLAESKHKYVLTKVELCLKCQRLMSQCDCDEGSIPVALFRIEQVEKSRKGVRQVPVEHLGECPRCRDKALGDTEIATSVSMYSTTPLSILTNELYRMLPDSPDSEVAKKPGQGRKLLSFYDSRQGAARFAAFLQDAVNDQVYRHIVPLAVERLEQEKERMPDFEEVVDRCFAIAWEYQIFHNDPELSDELGRTRHPSRAQRERLKARIRARVMAEFTTQRRYRQSLESLGLIAVHYFERDWEPSYDALADAIGLEPAQVRDLIGLLMDGLRNQKVVVLPQGVERDSEVFGRNKFNYRLVRSKAQKYEAAWLGETERQHRRLLIRKVLLDQGLSAEAKDQERVLIEILDWLLEHTDLLQGDGARGYQLAHDRLFFTTQAQWFMCDQCHRMSSRGEGGLPCAHPACLGHLQEIAVDDAIKENYYHHVFTRKLIPMRVEEHTAQIDSKKGRQYQNDFRNGNINVLSCSTTFEMGIDLGDLQAIVLSNIPPTVANYKQRAGRAGRRVSGTAFILSWASDRPHDQTYFTSPTSIINGRVRVPHLALQNRFILQRHINAILFSAYMRHRAAEGYEDLYQVGDFFDQQVVDQPHYDGLHGWLKIHKKDVQSLLKAFCPYLNGKEFDPMLSMKQFAQDMQSKAAMHYAHVTGYYNNEIASAAQLIGSGEKASDHVDTIDRYDKLLTRLRRDYLINYLSDRGVLPSYSFPLHTVELLIHPSKARGLRLERDVRQAIREYAPGQEIVADKRIWKSIGLMFFRETPQLFQYRICDHCNHLSVGKEAGVPIAEQDGPCPVCGESPANHKRHIYQYVEPDGFRSSKDSGMPAGQYVAREYNLTRSALIPVEPDDVQMHGETLETGYSRQGKLLYVNEGSLGHGFKICLICGLRVSLKKMKCPGTYRGAACPGDLQRVTLGFQEVTDTLRLTFNSTSDVSVPSPENRSFWLSLMYAFIHGASHALQIERRDIDGVLFPRQMQKGQWQQTIVLFDDVPGGAGHVRQIREEIVPVVQAALKIANCVDCAPDSSCYHCLRDFQNQYDHHILRRGPVATFLEALLASLKTSEDPLGANPVVALNLPRWLMQTVGRAQHQLLLAADEITLHAPAGETKNWLDVLHDLLKRNVQVTLGLTSPLNLAADNPEGLSVARYLQVLMENGLDLQQLDDAPPWRILIDPQSELTSRAITSVDGDLSLSSDTGQEGLKTIRMQEQVTAQVQVFLQKQSHSITIEDLAPPENVHVINTESVRGRCSEESLFIDVFEKPVRTLYINDRYLFDYYRIVERAGAYIQLAKKGDELRSVSIQTWDADRNQIRQGSREEQNRAIQILKGSFPDVDIDFQRPQFVDHDRYVLLERSDGSQARILIGKGLDFIRNDGTLDRTFIVIEDPFDPSVI